MVNIKNLKRSMKKKRPKMTIIPAKNFFSLGLTTLNLACSGHPDRGFAKGLFMLIVGDSSSGKTWLALEIAAAIANNPNFDDYQIVYDPAEKGAFMNIRKYFGKKLASRIVPPKGTMEEPIASSTVYEFYDHIDDMIDQGPGVYILDSMDPLVTGDEKKLRSKNRKSRESGKEEKGSYGVSKAKENSANLRLAVNRLQENGSVLIIICQTRQTIGFLSKYEPRTRSGGDALHFYNRLEMWLSRKSKIRKPIGKENVVIGQITRAKIVKNHICGWEGDIEIPIFKRVGIDNVGGCIDFLVKWGHWKESKLVIDAAEFDVKKKREQLAQFIEDSERIEELKNIVTKVWQEIEDKSTIKRKLRYD